MTRKLGRQIVVLLLVPCLAFSNALAFASIASPFLSPAGIFTRQALAPTVGEVTGGQLGKASVKVAQATAAARTGEAFESGHPAIDALRSAVFAENRREFLKARFAKQFNSYSEQLLTSKAQWPPKTQFFSQAGIQLQPAQTKPLLYSKRGELLIELDSLTAIRIPENPLSALTLFSMNQDAGLLMIARGLNEQGDPELIYWSVLPKGYDEDYSFQELAPSISKLLEGLSHVKVLLAFHQGRWAGIAAGLRGFETVDVVSEQPRVADPVIAKGDTVEALQDREKAVGSGRTHVTGMVNSIGIGLMLSPGLIKPGQLKKRLDTQEDPNFKVLAWSQLQNSSDLPQIYPSASLSAPQTVLAEGAGFLALERLLAIVMPGFWVLKEQLTILQCAFDKQDDGQVRQILEGFHSKIPPLVQAVADLTALLPRQTIQERAAKEIGDASTAVYNTVLLWAEACLGLFEQPDALVLMLGTMSRYLFDINQYRIIFKPLAKWFRDEDDLGRLSAGQFERELLAIFNLQVGRDVLQDSSEVGTHRYPYSLCVGAAVESKPVYFRAGNIFVLNRGAERWAFELKQESRFQRAIQRYPLRLWIEEEDAREGWRGYGDRETQPIGAQISPYFPLSSTLGVLIGLQEIIEELEGRLFIGLGSGNSLFTRAALLLGAGRVRVFEGVLRDLPKQKEDTIVAYNFPEFGSPYHLLTLFRKRLLNMPVILASGGMADASQLDSLMSDAANIGQRAVAAVNIAADARHVPTMIFANRSSFRRLRPAGGRSA